MKRMLVGLLLLLSLVMLSLNTVSADEKTLVDEYTKASTKAFFEKEDNGTLETANSVKPLQQIDGILTNYEDIDLYKIELPYKGDILFWSYLGNNESDNYYHLSDYSLKLLDSKGKEVLIGYDYEGYDYDTYESYYYKVLETTLSAGTYYIAVTGVGDYFADQSYSIYQQIDFKPDFKINSLTANLKSPQIDGKTITLTADSSTKGLEYQFYVNNKVVQKFSSSNSYKWKPTKPGKYSIKVEARNPSYPKAIASKTMSYTIQDSKVKITSFTKNKVSPRPTNTSIKWTAKATGVSLEYKFEVYENKKWKMVQGYSSKSSFNWTPKTAGTYKVKVTARSKVSKKTASKESGFTIFKPSYFEITSFKSNLKSPQTTGTYFYFTSSAKGSHLEYRFRVNDGYGWYTVQNWSGVKSLYWQPSYKGKYKIAVDVRQKGTTTTKTKTLSFDIKEAPAYNMNSDYDIYGNYGYLTVQNNGYSNLKVTKIEFLNNGKSIFSQSPSNWIVIGRKTQTFYFTPKKSVSSFNYNTVIKVHYTYDGMKHEAYLYR